MTKEQLEILKGMPGTEVPMKCEMEAIDAAIKLISRIVPTKDGVLLLADDTAWCIYDGVIVEEVAYPDSSDCYSSEYAASAALAAAGEMGSGK